jgi:hypothetical protein
MVALSQYFWSQNVADTTTMAGETPSIMFVIDNSGSMGVNPPHTDQTGQRFIITRAFLDTIMAKYPSAEVGLAVFGTYLYFDPRDSATHPYFKRCVVHSSNPRIPMVTDSGAYIPLLKLDSVYTNYGGDSGYTILRNILDTQSYNGLGYDNNRYHFVGLKYRPTNHALGDTTNPGGGGWANTNITAGYDAVKSAMLSASASNCSQYVIFMSDGVANAPGGNATNYFRDSVKYVPTTFTVFFPAGNVPGDIQTMTHNIRGNGYDLTHPVIGDTTGCTGRSNYWSSNTGNLMSTLSNNIWSLIKIQTQRQPAVVTVNGVTATTRSGDTAFYFQNMIPLTGLITPINVSLTYFYYKDGLRVGDTTFNYSYNVQTDTPHTNTTWNPPHSSFNILTWNRYLNFHNAVGAIDTPISVITETMDSVELYFTFDSGTAKYGYDGATGLGLPVYLSNKNAFVNGYDQETVYLQRVTGNIFSAKFKRQVSGMASPIDHVLQYHGATDSIVAVFRNQETDKIILPLDTLRKCIGFDSLAMHLSVTDTTITAGDTTHSIQAIVTDALGRTIDPTWVMPRITYTPVPATFRTGDAIITNIGQWGRFTGTMADTVIPRQITVTLTEPNGHPITATLLVRVRPAKPAHLWLEATSTPNMYTTNLKERVVFGQTQSADSVFAVLRDRFLNLVSFSTSTTWFSYNTSVVTVTGVAPATPALGEGILTKAGTLDSTWVRARNTVDTTLKDSVFVVYNNITYDQLMILRDVNGSGTPIQIHVLYDTLPNQVTLYVQGHRSDGLGGNGGWGPVSGNWSLSAGLLNKTTPVPPSSQTSWTFVPTDTGGAGLNQSITVSLPGGPSTSLNPVVFVAAFPNAIVIYPYAGTPNVSGNMAWPSAPAVADTMSADDIFSLLSAKLFYNTGSKIIWLSQYENTPPLNNQFTWTVTPPDRDTIHLTIPYCFAQLIARQAGRTVTVTAHWNTLSYSILIYVLPGAISHVVIEASPSVPNLYHDDPLAQITMLSNQTTGSGYAVLRDRWGNYVVLSTHTQWSSTDATCFTAASGNAAIGEGIATRVADQCQSIMIASDNVAVPGSTLRDSVPVILNNITHIALRIYDYDPAKDDTVTAISLPTDDSLTLYVEGQRSDNLQWEPVTAIWSKDASLDTKTNPPGTSQLWAVIANSVGSGWIKASRNEGAFFITDSVFATFTEGTPNSIALYRNLGDPAVVPTFPATDTVAAGSVDSVFAKIFDRNGKWLNRFETNLALSQQVISWTIQSVVQGQGPDTTLGLYTGRKTTFAPHIAYSLYRVTATFLDSGRTFSASAQIYVKPGPAQHISAEGQLVPLNDYTLLTHDSRQVSVHLGTLDTIYTQLFAVIRDRYGNFVDYSHNPYWVSRDLTVDTARLGISATVNGQGNIKRGRPGSGQAYNDVWDLTYGFLGRDSVLAILDSLQIVALRITFRDPISGYDTLHIPGNSITLQIGQSTTVYVQGQYSNGQWENVSGNWSYAAERDAKSGTGHSWLFPPSAVDTTHRGVITVTRGNLSTFISVNIITGPPGSLVFYSDSAAPGGMNDSLANPPQFITVTAGNSLKIAALIFDNSPNPVWLSSYLFNPTTAAGISWSAISRTHNNQDVHNMFDGSRTTGAVRYFTSTRAYDTVIVTAYLSATIIDSVIIVVQPAPANHIVLENTPNWWDHLNVPDTCITLHILDNADNGSVYAILRDQYGNAVAPYYPTLVRDSSSRPDSIGVVIPLSSDGQLEALRIGSGIGMIYAWDSHGNGDSCNVQIDQYHYKALRIVDQAHTQYADGYVLTINTNQDSTIYVQGQRTNDGEWETVSALWEILPSLQAVLPGSPRTDTLFTLSPTDTGSGWIRVTKGNYDEVTPDTLQLHFSPGPAVRATITILTPPAQRIAGQPIQYVDSLFNADGRLVEWPNLTSYPSAYNDAIGRGGLLRPEPFIRLYYVNGGTVTLWGTVNLDLSPAGAGVQTFVNGVDTGSFVLYYAPLNPAADSLHQIFASFVVGGDTMKAQTVPFALLSAPISSIEMDSTQNGGHPVIGPDTLYYNNSNLSQVLIFAIGYDPYHNNLGTVATNWNVISDPLTNWYIADSLHQITTPNPQGDIVYSAINVPRDQDGWIEVTYPSNPAISDRVYLYIHGPFVRLDSAVTADWSGNGLLDHMTLYFNKTVELDPGFTFQGMTIIRGGVSFTVDSILNLGHSDRVWVVALHEDNSTGSPQTAWTPVVTVPNLTNVHIDAASVTSLDGAGPVIWTVEEHRTNLLNDRTKDTVIVTFSEPVEQISPTISPLTREGTNPSELFYVWDSTGVRNTSMLTNITSLKGILTATDGSNYVKFLMYNGQDLTDHNYFSIDTVAGNYVVDLRLNKPNYNNQHVKVQVTGQPGDLLPAPNPATPYIGYPDNAPGQFHATENPEATQWVNVLNGGHGGALFQFTFQQPGKSSGVVVQCQIKIYDLVGNLVQADFNPDFYDSDAASDQVLGGQGLVTAHVYWNCTNAKGMVVAPGVYRVVAYLHYTDKAGSQSHEAHSFPDEKKVASLGVSR